jgi:hypothetical protein
MAKLKSVLGYAAATLTLIAAAMIPFLLIDVFTRGVAATGVRIDPSYSGGEPASTVDRGAYRIVVNKPVQKTAPLQRLEPFVQLTWTPASALPHRVSDVVDIDGDGAPDAAVTFEVPKNASAPLRAEVAALTAAVKGSRTITRGSFSSAIARVGDSVVVRIPLP